MEWLLVLFSSPFIYDWVLNCIERAQCSRVLLLPHSHRDDNSWLDISAIVIRELSSHMFSNPFLRQKVFLKPFWPPLSCHDNRFTLHPRYCDSSDLFTDICSNSGKDYWLMLPLISQFLACTTGVSEIDTVSLA